MSRFPCQTQEIDMAMLNSDIEKGSLKQRSVEDSADHLEDPETEEVELGVIPRHSNERGNGAQRSAYRKAKALRSGAREVRNQAGAERNKKSIACSRVDDTLEIEIDDTRAKP